MIVRTIITSTAWAALLIAAIFAWPSVVHAQSPVELESDVYVERLVAASDGRKSRIIEKADHVLPGDELIFVLSYENTGAAPAHNFAVTNPLPRTVAFREAADRNALVSVDGGKNWGRLDALRVARNNGRTRPAKPRDVTHIKWRFRNGLASGTTGKLVFRGTVR